MCRDSHSQGLLWRQTAQNKIGILANLRNKNAPSLRNAPRSPQEQQDATAHTDTTRTHVLIRNGRKEVTFSFNLRKELSSVAVLLQSRQAVAQGVGRCVVWQRYALYAQRMVGFCFCLLSGEWRSSAESVACCTSAEEKKRQCHEGCVVSVRFISQFVFVCCRGHHQFIVSQTPSSARGHERNPTASPPSPQRRKKPAFHHRAITNCTASASRCRRTQWAASVLTWCGEKAQSPDVNQGECTVAGHSPEDTVCPEN